MTGRVLLEHHGKVALVTISAPEVRNALTPDMASQLAQICDHVTSDPTMGALVLRGDGGTFCSGADTRRWAGRPDPASTEAFAQTSTLYASFLSFGQLGVPTVAAVRGAAVGAGLNLALAADLRVVSDTARLIGGFADAGIHPGGGFFTLANRLAGREATAAMGLFGQEITGQRAAILSLAWEATPDHLVESRALELASRAAEDPELIRKVVATFRAELGPPAVSWPAAVEMERGTQMWSQHRRRANESKVTRGGRDA